MKKIDVGQLLSILANIGVIAEIIFLAVEIRQNTRSQEASSYQTLMAGIARFNEVEISNPDVLQLLGGIRGTTLAEMELDDRTRAQAYMFIQLRFGDMAFHQFELGLISAARPRCALPANAAAAKAFTRRPIPRIGRTEEGPLNLLSAEFETLVYQASVD